METIFSKHQELLLEKKGFKILTVPEKKEIENQYSTDKKRTELRISSFFDEETKQAIEYLVTHTVYPYQSDPNLDNNTICQDYQNPKPNIRHLCIDFFNRAYRTPLLWRSSSWFSEDDLRFLAHSCKVNLFDSYIHRLDQDGYELTLKTTYETPLGGGDFESLKKYGFVCR